jgi:hypothetical protein
MSILRITIGRLGKSWRGRLGRIVRRSMKCTLRAIDAGIDHGFARRLQVFQILFAKEKAIEGNLRPTEISAAYSAGLLPNESIPVR